MVWFPKSCTLCKESVSAVHVTNVPSLCSKLNHPSVVCVDILQVSYEHSHTLCVQHYGGRWRGSTYVQHTKESLTCHKYEELPFFLILHNILTTWMTGTFHCHDVPWGGVRASRELQHSPALPAPLHDPPWALTSQKPTASLWVNHMSQPNA